MTPGDPTEQLPRTLGAADGSAAAPASGATSGTGSSGGAASGAASSDAATSGAATSGAVHRIPMRPEDVDKARAEAKAAKLATRAAAPAAAATTQAVAPSGSANAATTAARTAERPAAAKKAPAKAAAGSGRRVKLTVSRIDPWSALKMSFLLSVALGIALVVATAALWLMLAGMGAFDQVNNLVGQIVQDGDKKFDIMDFVGFGRVVSLSIVVAVIDVFLWTAIATLGAFIYNVSASLVGGLHLTLTDD